MFNLHELKPSLPPSGDATGDQIVRLVSDKVGATGWEIVRALKGTPDEIQLKLAALVSNGFIRAEGAGLDAYYAPSKQVAKFRVAR
jgi:hypothetical protein